MPLTGFNGAANLAVAAVGVVAGALMLA